MQVQPVQVVRHEQMVWENPTAEAIRRAECLCHHCDRMRPGTPEHCSLAQQFYEICKAHGTAFVLSRCDSWKEKPGQVYQAQDLANAAGLGGLHTGMINADALSRNRGVFITRIACPQSNAPLPYSAPSITGTSKPDNPVGNLPVTGQRASLVVGRFSSSILTIG